MQKTEYTNIGEVLFTETLPNGLTIQVLPKRGFKKSYAVFATNYGGADRRFKVNGQWIDTPAGVAHFLEHKMFDTPDGGNALAVLSAIILFFGGILETLTFLFNKAVNSSIGTIGGADGPTAIYVTTSKDAWLYQLSICLLLLAMGLIGFFALRRCPKKENEPQD